MLSMITAPIAFSVPSTDKLFSPESRARVIEICTEKKQCFNMKILSDVGHGFAVSSFSSPMPHFTQNEQLYRPEHG